MTDRGLEGEGEKEMQLKNKQTLKVTEPLYFLQISLVYI